MLKIDKIITFRLNFDLKCHQQQHISDSKPIPHTSAIFFLGSPDNQILQTRSLTSSSNAGGMLWYIIMVEWYIWFGQTARISGQMVGQIVRPRSETGTEVVQWDSRPPQ